MPDTQNSNKEKNTGTQKKEKIAVSEAIRLKKTNRNVAFACVLILGFAVVLSAGGFVAAMIGKDTVATPQEHIHACSSWQVIKQPTDFEEGSAEGVCSACGEDVTVTLPVLKDGSYTVKTIVEATCGQNGTKKYTYKKDGLEVSFNVTVHSANHKYSDWVLSGGEGLNATKATMTCSVCHDVRSVDLQSYKWNKNTEDRWWKDPTCTTSGNEVWTYYAGEGLPLIRYEKTVAALEHDYTAWEIVQKGTGEHQREYLSCECSHDAGHIIQVQIPNVKGESVDISSWKMVRTTATCESAGYTIYEYTGEACESVPAEKKKQKVETAAFGHALEIEFAESDQLVYNRKDGTVTVPYQLVCKTDFFGVTDEGVFKTGGVVVSNGGSWTAPTCTQDGKATFTAAVKGTDCIYNGMFYTASQTYTDYVLPKGHWVTTPMDKWETYTDDKTGKPGILVDCEDCGRIGIIVPASIEEAEADAQWLPCKDNVPPTCTADGYSKYYYVGAAFYSTVDGTLMEPLMTKAFKVEKLGHKNIRWNKNAVYDPTDGKYYLEVTICCDNEKEPFPDRIWIDETNSKYVTLTEGNTYSIYKYYQEYGITIKATVTKDEMDQLAAAATA